mmetsp:Transcript_9190/g.21614  ORF Transcript_9190/g.21614 Transcript_9190/m.21614 type:complete len:254 (+) Transcript_9190:1184-1945(+)
MFWNLDECAPREEAVLLSGAGTLLADAAEGLVDDELERHGQLAGEDVLAVVEDADLRRLLHEGALLHQIPLRLPALEEIQIKLELVESRLVHHLQRAAALQVKDPERLLVQAHHLERVARPHAKCALVPPPAFRQLPQFQLHVPRLSRHAPGVLELHDLVQLSVLLDLIALPHVHAVLLVVPALLLLQMLSAAESSREGRRGWVLQYGTAERQGRRRRLVHRHRRIARAQAQRLSDAPRHNAAPHHPCVRESE